MNRFVWNMIDGLYQTVGDDIRIHPHLPRGLWRVRVDEDEFETALLNLADNAREAMPDGGGLTIRGENVVLGDEGQGGARPVRIRCAPARHATTRPLRPARCVPVRCVPARCAPVRCVVLQRRWRRAAMCG